MQTYSSMLMGGIERYTRCRSPSSTKYLLASSNVCITEPAIAGSSEPRDTTFRGDLGKTKLLFQILRA